MLTIIRGQDRKSVYMGYIAQARPKSIIINYGTNVNHWGNKGVEIWSVDRKLETVKDLFQLQMQINDIIADILNNSYDNVFIYGNFRPNEVKAFDEISLKIDGMLNIYIDVHDTSLPPRQVIIEERT